MPSSRRSRPVSKSKRIRHRRLRFEALEDRRVLAGGIAPELPGMYLVDPDVDKLRGQVIYLEYDGEENVTYNGPVTIGPFDIPPFVAPGELAGQEDAIMAEVAQQLNDLFAPVDVTFTLDRPDPAGTYSSVYIGGDGSWATDYGDFLGLAEQVDVGNQDPADNAFVFTQIGNGQFHTSTNYVLALGDLVSHEVGHLLGYGHAVDLEGMSPLHNVGSFSTSPHRQPYKGSYQNQNILVLPGSHDFILETPWGTAFRVE